MSPEREALFMCAAHCQGGHSQAGYAASKALSVPFPISMGDLVKRVRAEGQNPARLYPWLIKMATICHGPKTGQHSYFTPEEIATVAA